MRDLLYYVVTKTEKHYFYRIEDAKKYFQLNGGKLYAYTKDLFPTKALLYW